MPQHRNRRRVPNLQEEDSLPQLKQTQLPAPPRNQPKELTLNVYDTGSVVFQGAGASSALALQIAAFIDQINAPVQL